MSLTERTGSEVTVEELFGHVGLKPHGPKRWIGEKEYEEVSEFCAGVYVVALAKELTSPPWAETGEGSKENTRNVELVHWLKNQVILYIGQTTKQTLSHRVHQMHVHKYGDESPHRGGQAVHLLNCERLVYWAATQDPRVYEKKMLEYFKERVRGPKPFANRRD